MFSYRKDSNPTLARSLNWISQWIIWTSISWTEEYFRKRWGSSSLKRQSRCFNSKLNDWTSTCFFLHQNILVFADARKWVEKTLKWAIKVKSSVPFQWVGLYGWRRYILCTKNNGNISSWFWNWRLEKCLKTNIKCIKAWVYMQLWLVSTSWHTEKFYQYKCGPVEFQRWVSCGLRR